MSIPLSTRICFRILGFAWGLLCLGALAMELLGYLRNEEELWGLFPMFSLHDDQNLPRWYLAGLWLGLGLLCWLKGRTDRRAAAPERLAWSGLALFCVALSLDEATGFVARLPDPLFLLLGRSAAAEASVPHLLALALLVILLGLAGLVLALGLFLFLRRWPKRSLQALAAAGLLFAIAEALAGAHLPFRLWHLFDGGEGGGVLVVNLRAHASFFTKLAGASLLFAALFADLQATLGRLQLVILPAQPGLEDAEAAAGHREVQVT